MGIAFDDVKVGPGVAYFPTVSLAIDESLTINFGSSPLYYPQTGFQPLQQPPNKEVALASAGLMWAKQVVHLLFEEPKVIFLYFILFGQ